MIHRKSGGGNTTRAIDVCVYRFFLNFFVSLLEGFLNFWAKISQNVPLEAEPKYFYYITKRLTLN